MLSMPGFNSSAGEKAAENASMPLRDMSRLELVNGDGAMQLNLELPSNESPEESFIEGSQPDARLALAYAPPEISPATRARLLRNNGPRTSVVVSGRFDYVMLSY